VRSLDLHHTGAVLTVKDKCRQRCGMSMPWRFAAFRIVLVSACRHAFELTVCGRSQPNCRHHCASP
jgi:hypothetical protein